MKLLTWNQIREWLVFDELEPIGRDWQRTGLATLVTSQTSGGKAFEVEHFKPLPEETDD